MFKNKTQTTYRIDSSDRLDKLLSFSTDKPLVLTPSNVNVCASARLDASKRMRKSKLNCIEFTTGAVNFEILIKLVAPTSCSATKAAFCSYGNKIPTEAFNHSSTRFHSGLESSNACCEKRVGGGGGGGDDRSIAKGDLVLVPTSASCRVAVELEGVLF